jgi:PAS domain S-box-containing protein
LVLPDSNVHFKAPILLVDDRKDNLLVLKTVLANLPQLELITCESGQEAIDYMTRHEVAAVALDVQMPVMDGFETAERIRKIPHAKDTPILFVTALNADEIHTDRAYNLGATDFISKPVNANAVRAKLLFFARLYRNLKELERTTEALAQSAENEKSLLLETALDAVIGADENNLVRYWNQHAEKMFGWSKEEILGHDMTDIIIPPAYRAGHRAGVRRFVSTGVAKIQNQRIKIPALRRDGNEFPIELTVTTLKSSDGYRFFSFIRDISEEVRAKEAMEQRLAAEEDLVATIETMTEGFSAYDQNYVLVGVNSQTEQFMKRPRKELLGKTAEELFPSDDRRKFQAHYDEVIRTGNPARFIESYEGAYLQVHAYRARSGGVNAFFRDITESVTSRQKLEAYAEESTRLNRLKDEFLATLSHEMRTPINVIQGYAELMRSEGDSLPEHLRESVDAIYRNAKAQTEIVSDLLDVSSIITGKFSHKPVTVAAREFLSGIVSSLMPIAEASGVVLKADLRSGPAHVKADPVRLHQIFSNLLSNAIKFSKRGGKVDVIVTATSAEWTLEVSDEGAGIAPEFLPHVFDRFRQQDSSTTRRYGGLGLGLSVAKSLTEMHGGRISAESPGVGLGAKFTVTMPIGITDIASTQQPLGETHSPGRDSLNGVKILLVEDSPDNRTLISRFLIKAGATVEVAESARFARETLKQFQPHVIVSDVGMPEENGMEFIRRLKSEGTAEQKGVPTIALTAYVRPEEQEEFVRAGFDIHVSKPVSSSQLIEAIQRLIAARSK